MTYKTKVLPQEMIAKLEINMGIATINPATGELVKSFEALTDAEIESKLALAQQAFESYRQTSMSQRAQWLNKAGEILESDRERYGKILTLEM